MKDFGHLVRMALVFVAGVLLFVVARAALVPSSFGKYGHYRGDSIQENAARPVKFAGQNACSDCHGDVLTKKTAGKHTTVRCEACHGALATHADDPSIAPKKLVAMELCVTCHEMNRSRPKSFPQVASAAHSEGIACDTCHDPHSPFLAAEKEAKGKKP